MIEINDRESARETSANGSEAVNIVPGICCRREGLASRKPQGLPDNGVRAYHSRRRPIIARPGKNGLKEIGESRCINFVDLCLSYWQG